MNQRTIYKIKIIYGAKTILDVLNKSGYEAYIVGGCVRDSILGVEPKDWDICTSAKPNEIIEVFKKNGTKYFESGVRYGTITAVLSDGNYEVTTYRVDGEYEDGRHPTSVEFTSNVISDLLRRDFTVNAVAYNEKDGFLCPLNRISDIENKVIRCVGDPDKRFAEDGLRILRAMRFSCCKGFSIAEETKVSMHKNKDNLLKISKERINTELCKILLSNNSYDVLHEFSDIIATIIPQMSSCIGFNQNNKYHCYDVYEHMIHAVSNTNSDDICVKLALFLHDIGKPLCYTEDENGGHFYGHPEVCSKIAHEVLTDLRFDSYTVNKVTELVKYHDINIEPSKKYIRKLFSKFNDVATMSELFTIKYADMLAHTEGTQNTRIEKLCESSKIFKQLIDEEHCFSIKDLAVNGNDIISLGVEQGKNVGYILSTLLDAVLSEKVTNTKESLLDFARGFIYEKFS